MFEGLRRTGWVGLAALLGAAAMSPKVLPAVGRAARPVAKSALKAGVVAVEKAREVWADVAEAGDDLLAEVRSELEGERRMREAEEAARAAAEAPPASEPGRTPQADDV